jgi:hypothetical protein
MTTFQRHEIDWDEDIVLQTVIVLIGLPMPRDHCGAKLLKAILPFVQSDEISTLIETVFQRLKQPAITPTQEAIDSDKVAVRDFVISNTERGGTVEIHEGVGVTLHLNAPPDVIHSTVMALPGEGIEMRKAYLHSTITAGIHKVTEFGLVKPDPKTGAN